MKQHQSELQEMQILLLCKRLIYVVLTVILLVQCGRLRKDILRLEDGRYPSSLDRSIGNAPEVRVLENSKIEMKIPSTVTAEIFLVKVENETGNAVEKVTLELRSGYHILSLFRSRQQRSLGFVANTSCISIQVPDETGLWKLDSQEIPEWADGKQSVVIGNALGRNEDYDYRLEVLFSQI